MHRSDFFSLSPDLPIVLEIVDEEERINLFLKEIDNIDFDGLVFTADVNVVKMG
jgi:PII-like signaling protein